MAQQRVRDILLRIRGDSSDAEQDLHDLARELTKFDGTVAEATVDIDATPANRKIDAATKAVKDFGRLSEQAKIDLQDQAARVKLDRLRTNLENLQKKPTSPKVDIAIGATVAKIERVEAQLDKLDRRRVDIDVDVGRGVGGVVAGAGAVFAKATQGLGLFVSAASTGLPIIGGVGRLMAQLGVSGARLGPIFLALIPVMIGAAAAVALLSGAVVALGASFLTAAAGVGVLAVALAAAFGPVLLVAIAAMARFAKVLEAVKGAEEGTAAASDRAADAADRVKTTAVDAYREWARAAEETRDAIRGIAQAELSRDQARLNVKKAEQNLKELRQEAGLTSSTFDGLFKKFTDVNADTRGLAGAIKKAGGRAISGATGLDLEQGVLDLQQARLNEADAIDGVSDAHTRLEDARAREQEFIQNGIAAYEPYTAALTASAEAQLALVEATKDLTPQEQRLVDVLVELKETLTTMFRPATRAIFEGLLDLLEDIADFAKDTGVRRGFREIGTAIGNLFRAIGRETRRKEFRDAFATFAEGGAAIIRTLTPVFRTFFRTITRLAEAAMPWLLELIRSIGRAFRRWAGDIDRSGIEDFVRRVRRSFNIWKGIVEELWLIVKEFFGDSKDSGDELAETIRKILVRFRLWLHENTDSIKTFFQVVATSAVVLADALDRVVTAVKFISDNPVVLSPIAGAAQSGIFGNIWNALTGNFGGMPKQLGGVIPGVGSGDIVPAMLEPGEFVIRRSVAQAIGIPRLNLLNAGAMPKGYSRGGVVIQQQDVHLPAAPGHGQLGDARHQAVLFAREMARRGGTPVTR